MVSLAKPLVALNAAMDANEDIGRIEKMADTAGVSGQTVAIGSWITVVGKT